MPAVSQDARKFDLQQCLARFSLSSFLPGQQEVISAVLSGEDCLCIMPTGGGKSLCFQLPAVVRDGTALVISPLIALMKDQVDSLAKLDVSATFINSTLDPSEQGARLQRMAAGQYDLVYIAPERFRSPRFIEAIGATAVQLLAVDEAHCISEWGHDFRHDYTRLGKFRRRIGNPQTIALTATATPEVRKDVVEQLRLKSPKTFVAGFSRPNLHYSVLSAPSEAQKSKILLDFLQETPGSGIIYCSTRKRCEEVAETAAKSGDRKTCVYHGGMEMEDRRRRQEDFMQGRAQIVAATNAFGMGIDKPDVRFVVHYNIPGSVEAYYQEAGRAGRDGLPAQCLMLYTPSDRYVQEFFIESGNPSREVVAEVYNYLRSQEKDPIELTQQELKEHLGLSIGAEGVGTCERLLEKCGVLTRLEPRQNMALVQISGELLTLVDLLPTNAKARRKVLQAMERVVGPRRGEHVYFHVRDVADAVEMTPESVGRALRALTKLEAFDYVPPFRGRAVHMLRRDLEFDRLGIDFETMERRKAADYEKLERTIRYARNAACRQLEILHYFGDLSETACGNCDNCRAAGVEPASSERTSAPDTDDDMLREAVRMALSGVARVAGKFGKNVVAQMLWGSKSATMSRWKLNKLSTYGLLKHLRLSEVGTLLDALIRIGLIEQNDVDRYKPVVQLTPRGEAVMRGQAAVGRQLKLPDRLVAKIRRDGAAPEQAAPSEKTARDDESLPAADPTLLQALRSWRTNVAGEDDVPSYFVLSNDTLDRLARIRPDTPEQLASVKGIGETKLQRYGAAILALIAQATPPAADAEPEVSADVGQASCLPKEQEIKAPVGRQDACPTDGRPSHYWTWRLLSDGYSAAECAEIRGVAPEEVLDHLLRAAENGLSVQIGWLLSPEQITALEKAVGPEPPQRLRPLLAKLPQGIQYEHLQLFLRCRTSHRKAQ